MLCSTVGVHGDYHNDEWDERILAVKVFQLEQSFVSANLPHHVTQVVYKSPEVCGVYRSARQSVLSHRPCRTEADALPFPPVFGGPVFIEIMQIVSAFPFALSIVIPVYNGAESVSVLDEALSRLEVQGALE